jgi:hypothetical protein
MACAFPSYNLPIPFQLYAMGTTTPSYGSDH